MRGGGGCLFVSVELKCSVGQRERSSWPLGHSLLLGELASYLSSWIIYIQKIRRKSRSINTVYSTANHEVKIKSTEILGLSVNKNKVTENTKLIVFCQIKKVNR